MAMDELLERLRRGEMTDDDARLVYESVLRLGSAEVVFDQVAIKAMERNILIDARNKQRTVQAAIGKRQQSKERGHEILHLANWLLSQGHYESRKKLAEDIQQELDEPCSIKTIERRLIESGLI